MMNPLSRLLFRSRFSASFLPDHDLSGVRFVKVSLPNGEGDSIRYSSGLRFSDQPNAVSVGFVLAPTFPERALKGACSLLARRLEQVIPSDVGHLDRVRPIYFGTSKEGERRMWMLEGIVRSNDKAGVLELFTQAKRAYDSMRDGDFGQVSGKTVRAFLRKGAMLKPD